MRGILLRICLLLATPTLAGACWQRTERTVAEPAPIPELREKGQSLPFRPNDYAAALARAKSENRPLFVDVWAPWCHTCRFMDSQVFTDPALKKWADHFVWLSVDTENPANAAFVEKFPTDNWPSFLILDPRSEKPLLKWMGAASVAQLDGLFSDGEKAFRGESGQDAASLLAHADELSAARKFDEASAAYDKAIAAGGPQWDRRPRSVESLMSSLFALKASTRCAQVAKSEAVSLPRGSSYANSVAMGLSCAGDEPEPARTEDIKVLRPQVEEAIDVPGVLADDRSSLFETLVNSYEASGDGARAKEWASRWLAFVQAQQREAPSPSARMAFDPHLVLAAQHAGHPESAVPELQRSEKEMPQDYNPPARLALLYRAMNDFPRALDAHDRAIAKAYGPRRVLLLEQKAQTQLAMKDVKGAKASEEAAQAVAAGLPEAQKPSAERSLARLHKAVRSAQWKLWP